MYLLENRKSIKRKLLKKYWVCLVCGAWRVCVSRERKFIDCIFCGVDMKCLNICFIIVFFLVEFYVNTLLDCSRLTGNWLISPAIISFSLFQTYFHHGNFTSSRHSPFFFCFSLPFFLRNRENHYFLCWGEERNSLSFYALLFHWKRQYWLCFYGVCEIKILIVKISVLDA